MPHWRWAWHAEIEKFPSAVMAARHPGSINLGDVLAHDFTHRAAAIARPNILVFGSPCQSFSTAGKRLGLDDPRGNLALVALGIVDRLKPDWFVFENVPGLLSSGGGRDFGSFLGTVEDIGYHGCWDVLDAQWFGVAQRRQRVFFVGNSRDWRHSAAVLLEPESLRGHYPPGREAGQRPAPTIASRPTGGGGLGTDFDCDGGLISRPLLAKGNDSFDDTLQTYVTEVAHCLNAGGMGWQDYETETEIAHALRADGFDASEDGTGRGTPLIAFSSNDYGADAGSIAPTLRTMGHPAVALRGREGGGTAELSDVPSALRASGGGGDKAHVLTSTVRRLTPRECERLQSFEDDYTLIVYRGKPAADGPRYKALGNSMNVKVIRRVLTNIEIFERDVRPRIAA